MGDFLDFDFGDLDLGSRGSVPRSQRVSSRDLCEDDQTKDSRRPGAGSPCGPHEFSTLSPTDRDPHGVAGVPLPPFLLHYARRRPRPPTEFSGPSVLQEESDEGCVEYKLRLSADNPIRFEQLVTQLKFRLAEGGGHCIYCVGVEDNGHPLGLDATALADSIAVLETMAREVDATATIVHNPPGAGEGLRCAVVAVRRRHAAAATRLAEARVAVSGGTGGGKSTLISVLTQGADGVPALDNARGSARMAVLRHKHEIQSGRTSCVSHHCVGYGSVESGRPRVLNYGGVAQLTPREVAASAAKLVRLSDAGGAALSAAHALTAGRPDYVLLVVCSTQGVSQTTLDHLATALALGLPAFAVVTKIDAPGAGDGTAAAAEVAAAASRGGLRAVDIADEAQATEITEKLPGGGVLPVFRVSSVTGAGLWPLHAFLNALPPRRDASDAENALFQAEGVLQVAGVGPVLSGVVAAGRLMLSASLLAGPDDGGSFRPVVVAGLHRAQVEVDCVAAGQHATVALAPAAPETAMAETAAEDRMSPVSHGGSSCRSAATGFDPVSGPEEGPSSGSSSGGSPDSGLASPAGDLVTSNDEDQSPADISSGSGSDSGTGEGSGDDDGPGRRRQDSSTNLSTDLDLLGRSWDFLRLLSPASPSAVAAQPPCSATLPRLRKGTVLIDSAAASDATISFEAVVAMLGGSWPAEEGSTEVYGDGDARGLTPRPSLLSLASSSSMEGLDVSIGATQAPRLRRSRSQRSQRSQRPAAFQFTAHCGGVRQSVQLEGFEVVCNDAVAARGAAAAGVLGQSPVPQPPRVVRAALRFVHRPEWVQPGAAVVLRDRETGMIAGAGVVVEASAGAPPA